MEPEFEFKDSGLLSQGDSPIPRPAKASSPGKLGKHRRQMVLIMAFIGLLTSISPLIKTDPEVLGRTQWSPFQIAVELHKGALPVYLVPGSKPIGLWMDALMGFGAVYVLLLVIASAALFFPRSRLVAVAAALGAGSALGGIKFRFSCLLRTIFGPQSWASYDGHSIFVYPDHVIYGNGVDALTFFLILLGVFGLLAWIAVETVFDD